MYTEHRYCPKNTKDFLAVGDPYTKKKEINARFKGTQFKTNPAKVGQNAGTFTKFPEHKSDPYIDSMKAPSKTFKSVGFGSNDADRRGTFTLDVLCKQWKEKLKAETVKIANGQIGDDETLDPEQAEASFRRTYPNPQWFQTNVPFHSYDIGREGQANGTTPICNKCSRETFYCRHRIKARVSEKVKELRRSEGANDAMSPTSYNTYGSWTAEGFPSYIPLKRKAGRVSTTKQFFDGSHLSPGWGS